MTEPTRQVINYRVHSELVGAVRQSADEIVLVIEEAETGIEALSEAKRAQRRFDAYKRILEICGLDTLPLRERSREDDQVGLFC